MSPILSGSWAAAALIDKASANPAIPNDLCNIDLCNIVSLHARTVLRVSEANGAGFWPARMTGSACPPFTSSNHMWRWARRFAPLPTLRIFNASPSRPLQSFDCRPLAAGFAADGRARPFGDAGLDAERVVERVPCSGDIRCGRRLIVMANVMPNECARHAELAIGLKVRVIVRIDLRNVCLEPRLVDQKMQMRRAHVGTALGAQQIAHRPVHRYRIAGRLDTAERDVSVGVGGELAAQVHVGLHRVLILVISFRRRMPNIDLGAGNRLALRVLDPGVDENRLARRRRTHDRSPVLRRGRIRAPEWAKQVRGGLGGAVVAIVEQANKGREAK